ncbi:hypothetical protein WCLP8_2930014 [uncultured Gammaproteobacteria bacterium]
MVGREAANQALDGLAAGVVLVDRTARVLWANATAEHLLSKGDGLKVTRGRIVAIQRGCAQELQRLIALAVDTASAKSTAVGDILRVERSDRGMPLAVLVCPLRPTSKLFGATVPGALVLIKDPDHKATLLPQTLTKLFGLTSAESRVAEALAAGKNLEEISEDSGCKIATVRSQLKQCFQKTETNRQGELIRLLLSLPTTAR